VIEGTADGAGAAVGHLGGEFGAHAVDACFADAKRRVLGGHCLLAGGQVRLAQLASLRVLSDEGGAVARYLARGVGHRLAGGKGSSGPAGLVPCLLGSRTGGLALLRLRLGQVKLSGELGRAGAGRRSGLVLRVSLPGDGAERL